MADERPRFGETPARGSLNELHLTLLEIVSEEVAEVAADENDSALADVADALLCRSSVLAFRAGGCTRCRVAQRRR